MVNMCEVVYTPPTPRSHGVVHSEVLQVLRHCSHFYYRWSRSLSTVTNYGLDSQISIATRGSVLPLCYHNQTVYAAHPAPYPAHKGGCFAGNEVLEHELVSHLHLEPMLRMHGVLPLFSYLHNMVLKHGNNFIRYYYCYTIIVIIIATVKRTQMVAFENRCCV
jgi:hypothetical protein